MRDIKYTNQAEYVLSVIKGILRILEGETRQSADTVQPTEEEVRVFIVNKGKFYPQVICNVHEYFHAGKSSEVATKMLYKAYRKYLNHRYEKTKNNNFLG